MGGIQIIVIGDFYQLSPVPNRWIQDPGTHCFLSDIWNKLVPHKIILQEVHRQSNETFIKAVSETARGCPSQDTNDLIKSLDNDENRDVHLFSRRIDAHLFNHQSLQELPGPSKTYTSVEGHKLNLKTRKAVDAPSHLQLKVGAPVILTVNLSNNLVNGLDGRITEMNDDSVRVYFPTLKHHHDISKYTYLLYDRATGSHKFVCQQIPLTLAFALTIHKSQGMTLESVCIDCGGAFEAGQISVGIGRVKETTSLTVKNYRPGLCPPHHPKVSHFYGIPSQPLENDKSCCQQQIVKPTLSPTSDNHGSDDSFETDSCPEDEEEINLSPPDVQLPDSFDIHHFKQDLYFSNPITDMQKEINAILDHTDEPNFITWLKFLYKNLEEITPKKPASKLKPKETNHIISQYLHQFPITQGYQHHLKTVFSTTKITEAHHSLGLTSLLHMKDFYFHNMSQKSSTEVTATHSHPLCEATLAKIRYVGGMCVGRVISAYSDYVCRNIHRNSTAVEEKKQVIRVLSNHIFTTLTIAHNESNNPSSLQEIVSRQSPFGHLTIVDDRLFEIFTQFHRLIMPSLHASKFQERSAFKNILDTSLESLLTTEDFGSPLLSHNILRPILTKYLKTCVKEMGLRISHSHAKRKMAHRKQVIVEEASKGTSVVTTTEPPPPTPGPTSSPQPSTSQEVDNNTCSLCLQEWTSKNRLAWIECTSCSSWLHKKCDPLLKSTKEWRRAKTSGATYSCPPCRRNNGEYEQKHLLMRSRNYMDGFWR